MRATRLAPPRPSERPLVKFLQAQNLRADHDRRGALRLYEEVRRLDPDFPRLRYWEGVCLALLGEDERAIDLLREASRRHPDSLAGQRAIAKTLSTLGDTRGALAAGERAVRLAPGDAKLRGDVGVYLQRLGRFDEALEHYRLASAIGKLDPAFLKVNRRREAFVERVIALGARLEEVARGQGEPLSPRDRVLLALAARHRGRPEDAARLMLDAYREDPSLEGDRKRGLRLVALRSVAQAGAEPEGPSPRSTSPERATWRARALAWLQEDVARYEGLPPRGSNEVGDLLRNLVRDPALEGIRDEAALARLPAGEAQALRAVWADVDEAIRKRWEGVR